MAATEHCALTNTMVNALLLQIDPGHDEDTVLEIRKKFGEKVEIYDGFGRYDVVVIDTSTDFGLIRKFHEIGLSHVNDWFPLWGLEWNCPGKKDEKVARNGVLGLTFIKIDLDNAFKAGLSAVEAEEKLVQGIGKISSSKVYCSLGFNELIVATEVGSIEELAKTVGELKECTIYNNVTLALDISTIPALKPSTSAVKDEALEVYVLLSLKLGLTDDFKETIRQICLSSLCQPIFGFHDVLLKIQANRRSIIETIRKIRMEGKKHGVYSTFTIIPHVDQVAGIHVKTDLPEIPDDQVPYLENQDEQINFYKTWFKASRKDPITRHVFEDQVMFFSTGDKIIKRALSSGKGVVSGDENLFQAQVLDALRECLRVGFEQRTSGISPGNLLGPKSIRTEPLGSTQRATMAVEAIPKFLFKHLALNSWPGFCIHGYSSRFYMIESGIINIPHQFRVKPEMWWGVYHETGHAVFAELENETKSRILEEVKLLIAAIIRKYSRRMSLDEEILKEDYMRFSDEIFAELFGCHFGFNDDWELYKKNVWGYFGKELIVDAGHLSRTLLVYFTLGPKRNLARDEITIEEIDACIQEINQVAQKHGVQISEDDRDGAIVLVWAFLNIADMVKAYLLEKEKIFSEVRVQSIQQTLSKGQIVYSQVPPEIILSLIKTDDSSDYKQRFATILSMYNYYTESIKLSRENNV